MKKLLTLALAAATSLVTAQHCQFDFAAIVVLNIHGPDGPQVIPGLKVYLNDSAGNVVMRDNYRHGAWVKDTLWFWQNPEKTTFTGYIDNENPAEEEKIRFPFAKDHYVTVVPRGFLLHKYRIIIRDRDGELHGGDFLQEKIYLPDAQVYPLCGTFAYEEYRSRTPGIEFSPTEVVLTRR
jgi:hypothetical protein